MICSTSQLIASASIAAFGMDRRSACRSARRVLRFQTCSAVLPGDHTSPLPDCSREPRATYVSCYYCNTLKDR